MIVVGHVLNSSDMVTKRAMVPALRELIFQLETEKPHAHKTRNLSL